MQNKMDTQTILFCGPIEHPVNSGRYMIAGLEQLGYRVIGYDYRTRAHIEDDLIHIVQGERPRYVFTLKGELLTPPLIRRFRELGCVTILWFTLLDIKDWMADLARAHDFVVTNSEDHVQYFKKRGVEQITWMHQGFSPEHFGIDGPRGESVHEYYADVALIGSMGGRMYHKRCELVRRLRRQKIDVKWWGPPLSLGIKNLRHFWGGVHRAWAGKGVYMKEFADVIRHTKIFLGQDADIPAPLRYLSNRSFAGVGCGGFYLCRKTPGIEHVFEPGREIEVFDTDDEMVDKVLHYLKNDEDRRRIALTGQKKVLSQYTYKNQMEKILTWVREGL